MRPPVPGPRFDWWMSGWPGLAQLLQAAEIRQAGFGKAIAGVDAAALEHAEDVGGLAGLPRGQRLETGQDAVLRERRRRVRQRRPLDGGGLAGRGVGLARGCSS